MMWTILYWVFLAIAGVSLLVALFWDRAGFRGRPAERCRKCWYDLTGAGGLDSVDKDSPVLCTECGHKHTSVRSMRRTKRGGRALLVMGLMLLFAYGAIATPRMQRNGWVGLVPETAFVLSMPLLSDEPGSAMSFLNTGLGATAYEELLLDRFSADHGTLPLSSAELGWLNRRLVFWLAKRQSLSAVTDSSSVRGNVFGSLISSMLTRGQATAGEEAWANSVIYIEFDHEGAVPLNEYVYSGFKARRLKQGAYRLMIGRNKALFNGYTMMGTSFRPGFGRAWNTNEERIDSFRWDNLYKLANEGGVIRNPEIVALGRSYKVDEQTGAINVQVLILENEARRIDGDQWALVGDTHIPIRRPIDDALAIPTDAGEELGEELRRAIRAELTVKFDRGSDEWVPVLQLERRNRYGVSGEYDSVLFGGDVSVVVYSTIKGKEEPLSPRGIPVLKGTSQVWHISGNGRPEVRAIEPNKPLGRMEYAGLSIPNADVFEYELRVEVDPRSMLRFGDYAGFTGDVVYPFKVEFPLEKWTAEEMTKYLVSGIVPDHAMPER